MQRQRTAVAILALGLVATNGWWTYRSIDHDYAYSYLSDSFKAVSEQRTQAVAIAALLAKGPATKAEVIEAAKSGARGAVPFERDGHVWIGSLGLRFDSSGRLAGLKAD